MSLSSSARTGLFCQSRRGCLHDRALRPHPRPPPLTRQRAPKTPAPVLWRRLFRKLKKRLGPEILRPVLEELGSTKSGRQHCRVKKWRARTSESNQHCIGLALEFAATAISRPRQQIRRWKSMRSDPSECLWEVFSFSMSSPCLPVHAEGATDDASVLPTDPVASLERMRHSPEGTRDAVVQPTGDYARAHQRRAWPKHGRGTPGRLKDPSWPPVVEQRGRATVQPAQITMVNVVTRQWEQEAFQTLLSTPRSDRISRLLDSIPRPCVLAFFGSILSWYLRPISGGPRSVAAQFTVHTQRGVRLT